MFWILLYFKVYSLIKGYWSITAPCKAAVTFQAGKGLRAALLSALGPIFGCQ